MKTMIASLALCAILCGCATPSEEFYCPSSVTVTNKYSGPIIIKAVTTIEDENAWVLGALENNCAIIGSSKWQGTHVPSRQEIQNQARKVNACIVLVKVNQVGTISGVNTYTLPNPDRIVTSETRGTLYDPNGGTSFYRGETTTTVPGGQTTYHVPYTAGVYAVSENYFAKMPTPILYLNEKGEKVPISTVLTNTPGL